jgi:phage head maturation protease
MTLAASLSTIAPGAFSRSLPEFPDVLALVEHDTNRVLGRTTNGTLKLLEDERGLRVEIDPAPTSYGRDLVELVRRGDVGGMSFRFKPYPSGDAFDMAAFRRPSARSALWSSKKYPSFSRPPIPMPGSLCGLFKIIRRHATTWRGSGYV